MQKTYTLATKLYATFGGVLTLSLLLALLSWYSIQKTEDILDRSCKVTARKTVLAGEISESGNQMLSAQRGVIMNTLAGRLDQVGPLKEEFEQNVKRMEKAIEQITPLLVTDAGRRRTAEVREELVLWAPMFQEIVRHCATKNTAEAIKISDIVARHSRTLAASADAIVQLNMELMQKDEKAANDNSNFVMITLVLLLALIAAVGAAVFLFVRKFSNDLRNLAREMGEGADQVAGAANQISSTSQTLAQAASEQAASLEETSASAEEITSMTRKNADNSRSAADVMLQVDRHVGASNQTLGGMVTSMHSINESSEKVSKIIKVIDEIAFQTNILALNAAVEAARAGEAGMGFAVVADEVRSLAQRSAQAAKDTAALIEESIGRSKEGSGKLDQVSGVIRSITDSAGQVKTLIDEVNLGSQEQARGIEQIANAITQLDRVTQQNAANAEESASASEQLTAQAEAMREIIGRLQLIVGRSSDTPARVRKQDSSPRQAPKRSAPAAMPPAKRVTATVTTAPADDFSLDDFKDF